MPNGRLENVCLHWILDSVEGYRYYADQITQLMEQNVTNALEKLRSKGVAESLAKMFKVSFGQTHQAYHGTDKKFAEMIISNGFSIKENEKNWFGNGIYFFEWSFSEAQNWAKNIKKFNPPVVIKCIICLLYTSDAADE